MVLSCRIRTSYSKLNYLLELYTFWHCFQLLTDSTKNNIISLSLANTDKTHAYNNNRKGIVVYPLHNQRCWQLTLNSQSHHHHHQFLSLFVVEHGAVVKYVHPFLLAGQPLYFTPGLPPLWASCSAVLFLVSSLLGDSSTVPTSQQLHLVSLDWPVHHHFLSVICCLIGCWLVVSCRHSFSITSDHLVFKMYQRHLLIKLQLTDSWFCDLPCYATIQ